MRRLLLSLLAAGVALVSALAASTAAQAADRGPCVAGTKAPLCHFWTGKVRFVADGDTIDVDVDGDGTSAVQHVRFTGINAMELSRYSKYAARRRGSCHGLEATSFVEGLVRRSHGVVRLAAQDPKSRTGHRIRRSVAVRIDGRWQDLGRLLMAEGHALWLPNPVEWAHNKEYHELATQAAAARKNLWDPASCGAGPVQEAPLRVSVNWDADGDDEHNLNGEWIDISNPGPTAVPLGGWWVRDSWLIYNKHHVPGYEFPSYAVLPAGGSVRVYVGCGADGPQSPTRFHWCQDSAVFENASGGKKATGDGAYLFDTDGDLRAFQTYPCVGGCTDPLAGKARISANPTGPAESITVANTSAEALLLDGYVVKLHLKGLRDKFIFGYSLSGVQLAPGERLEIITGGSPRDDSRLVRHLGRGQYVLADGGNAVSLRSVADVMIDCAAWGKASC